MNSIKDSFADCSKCSLLQEPSCILETNSKSDLSKVDIVFVSENPGKNEVEKGTPLIGKAGQIFRKYFNKYVKKECKWLLTSCVLCLTLDEEGNTGNPTDETIERCRLNCFKIIEACNPKLIVLMGSSPMKAFELGTKGITEIRGKVLEWKGYQTLITVHPSYVNRNPSYEEKFERDIISAANIVTSLNKPGTLKNTNEIQKGEKGIFRYKIPEKFYTDEYRLVDVQYLNKTNEVLYIFRNKKNEKIYHKESDDYIAYVAPTGVPTRKIVPYDDLYQVKTSYKERAQLDSENTYEGDMRITVKHTMDYYHFNVAEAEKTKSNIMFADIEIDTGIDNRTFPEPKMAEYPINMISTVFDKKVTCYVIDNDTDPIEEHNDVEIKIFSNERKMLHAFISDFKEIDPDFISGWNLISFDMEYIFNRLPKIKLSVDSFSKFGEFYVDGFRYVCNIAGCVPLDQLFLYKSFTFTKKENYKLGTIGEIEVGETKVVMEYPINEMYYKDINKLIEYNIMDSILLDKLEDKLGHINLLNEIRTICNTSFDGGSSPFGQVDSLLVSFLRNKGMASKNSEPREKEKYPGAFVLEPIPGIYDYAADLDYTSLYPSLIMTYNIGVNSFVMRTEDHTAGYDIAYQPDKMAKEISMFIDPTYENKKVIMKKEDILKKIKDENLIHTINGCFFKNQKDELSVYSQVLETLLSGRRSYKKKMLDAKGAGNESMKDFYNTKQLVYKVLANSLYGIVANRAFRFFDINCASAITLGGQETLKTSIIEGDAYMAYLNGDIKDPLEGVIPVTRTEVYDKVMPNRKPKYIITGDTDSIFVCFNKFSEEKNNEKIINWCEKIQSYLNTESIKRTIKLHNVSDEYNKLELKNELVIKRGLFLAKKYYAIYVTNQEGREIQEVVYMGISVKRSDTPFQTKIFLKELLDMILKTESFRLPMLFKFITHKEKEFRKLIKEGSKTIAKPVGWGRPLSEYKKNPPQGVQGMLNFNNLLYPIHSIGNRGYLFHVAGIDLDKAPQDVVDNYNKNFLKKGKKLDIIVLPDEEQVLPNFLKPNMKMMLAKSFKERYELILKPLSETKKKEEIMLI